MMCSPESESIGETERAASILVASRRTVLPNVRVLAPSSVVGRSFLVGVWGELLFYFSDLSNASTHPHHHACSKACEDTAQDFPHENAADESS